VARPLGAVGRVMGLREMNRNPFDSPLLAFWLFSSFLRPCCTGIQSASRERWRLRGVQPAMLYGCRMTNVEVGLRHAMDANVWRANKSLT
jgi:hypothetical protein